MAERGWPGFMDGIDERMQKRKAGDGSGTVTPPPEWQPDSGWPAPPAGGQLRAGQTPISPHRVMDSAWAIAGGTAVFLGSLLPFVSFNDP